MKQDRILIGEKHSPLSVSLFDFEHTPVQAWKQVQELCLIPEGFLFLAGVAKYKRRCSTLLCYGKEHVFVQNFLPHSDTGCCSTRRYGAIYAFYEPEENQQQDDDVILETSSIYQAAPNNRVRLILGDGEHRKASCVAKMFEDICSERGFRDFSLVRDIPGLYRVTLTQKSCGYFLKGRTYNVWAKPIGIPDLQSGELDKGWLFCDVNCGIPAVMKADREEFIPLPYVDGTRVGLLTLQNGNLVYL